jgi:Glycosyltransferase family 87
MALEGSITEAYHSDKMFEMLKVYCGKAVSMPWTYPPPFGLIAAFLALLPFGLAYFSFITVTFIVYLVILRKLSNSLVEYNIALVSVRRKVESNESVMIQ